MSVDVGTLATIVTMLVALGGLYAALRREFRTELHSEIGALRVDLHRLETRVEKLDHRVYSLGVGLRPLIDRSPEA